MARSRSFLRRLVDSLGGTCLPARDSMPPALARLVHQRAGDDCELCGLPFWPGDVRHVHHWIAVAIGGPTKLHNLASVHEHCNLRVGVRGRAAALQLARAQGHQWREAARQNRIARRLLSV